MQPVSFDNDFECQNVVEEFTFEDEGKIKIQIQYTEVWIRLFS